MTPSPMPSTKLVNDQLAPFAARRATVPAPIVGSAGSIASMENATEDIISAISATNSPKRSGRVGRGQVMPVGRQFVDDLHPELGSCAPGTACCPATTKNGTPSMPRARAVRSAYHRVAIRARIQQARGQGAIHPDAVGKLQQNVARADIAAVLEIGAEQLR